MRRWFINQMARYASYHTDARNEATHHLGVPLIVFALLFALTHAPIGTSGLTAAWVLLAIVGALYTVSAPVVGGVTTALYAAVAVAAHTVAGMVAGPMAFGLFAATFIVGWSLQFWGHALEGRKPALLENLAQALMAPPFLVAGLLFRLGVARGLEMQILSERPRFFEPGDPRRADPATG